MDKDNDKYLNLPQTDRALVSSHSRSSISSCSSLYSKTPKNNKYFIIKDEEEKKDTTEFCEEIEDEFTIAMEEKIHQNKQAFTLRYTKVGIQ